MPCIPAERKIDRERKRKRERESKTGMKCAVLSVVVNRTFEKIASKKSYTERRDKQQG